MNLEVLNGLDAKLEKRFKTKLLVNSDLDRRLVSYQASKNATEERWCKYKEGYSTKLVRYSIDKTGMRGPILDPFVGSGTTLFASSDLGLKGVGIELLPCSAEIIKTRELVRNADQKELASELRIWAELKPWSKRGKQKKISVLRITDGAYPPETLRLLQRYLYEIEKISSPLLQQVFKFLAMSTLESISFTRKDGQYLRWDYRSNRRSGKTQFDKGKILKFDEAITTKLHEIAEDIAPSSLLFELAPKTSNTNIELHTGTCLNVMSQFSTSSFGGLITSPPYCNRYDYTRTYALELAFLGITEDKIKELRQTMLSCTVENRAKSGLDSSFSKRQYELGTNAFEQQKLLQSTLQYLEQCRAAGELNNSGIPRMVKNYFLELALVIAESYRVLKPGAPLVMVNDNVRYQGAHVPVDLILSDIAEKIGFETETIWVLPKGKGNSSQQMGKHGRKEIRKCVYVWRVPKGRRANRKGRKAAAES